MDGQEINIGIVSYELTKLLNAQYDEETEVRAFAKNEDRK